MCSVMDFSIAPIAQAEISSLLEKILELARFERLEHEVEATIESLQNSLCGPQASACALLAQHGDEPAGYALYFFTFCSFAGRRGLWLDDLYVRPQFRKQGLGRALIQEVARVGARHNCARFEWIALGWNENALNFYRCECTVKNANLIHSAVPISPKTSHSSNHHLRTRQGGNGCRNISKGKS